MDKVQSRDVSKVLRHRLSGRILRIIRQIGRLAEDENFSAYLVGGCVRDLLLRTENYDLDVVVETDALNLVKLLRNQVDAVVVTHRRFSTATITFSGGFKIDIASARKEHYADAACLPSVRLSSIKDDLFRRDFTINTLAVKINRHHFGQLLDLFCGQRDLKEGKIRVLHDKSFVDDPTRIFRAIRFEQRFDFTIERKTEGLIRQAIKEGMLKRLSKFRVGDEIILILKEEDPLKSLSRISKLCGFEFVHPLIKLDHTMIKQFKSAKTAIATFSKKTAGDCCANWLVYFMILTAKLNLEQLRQVAQDFSLTRKDLQKLDSFKKNSNSALKEVEQGRSLFAYQIYQILKNFSYEEVLTLFCLAKSKRAKDRIKLFLNKLFWTKITLAGKDLKKLRLKPGPAYKDIFQKVLYAKIAGRLKTKADEINYVKHILRK